MYRRMADEKNSNINMKFSKAVLQNDFTIMNAEEPLYDFLGKSSASFFNKLIHPDYEEEFLSVCRDMKQGEQYSIITMLRDRYENYHPVDIHVNISKPMEDGSSLYYIDIYGLDMIETSFLENLQKIDKYRTFMGIGGLVYMEYWPHTGRIVFYNYVLQKSYTLYESNIEEWHKAVVQYGLDKGSNIAEIEQWYLKLKNLVSQFSCTVKTGFLNTNHAPETLIVNARYISRHNADVLVGIVNRRDITDDDIPYYLTPAGKDAATDLLNKRALIEYTNDALSAAGTNRLYMILVDIDDFKTINDTYGHLMGDKAILVLTESITETLDGRGIVGRFGGDEFFILTEEIPDEHQLRLFLKAMLSKLSFNQINMLGKKYFTLSMGISQYPEAGKQFNDLFTLADKALYIAKDKGKNRYIIYRPQLHDAIDIAGRQAETGVYSTYTRVMKKLIGSMIVEKSTDVQTALESIKEAFGLGAAAVYRCDDCKAISYTSGCPDGLLDVSYMNNDSYRSLFSGENVQILNNLENIECSDKALYKKFKSLGCYSYISVTFPEFEKPEYIAVYYAFGQKHKWSSTEVDYLTMLSQIIYSAVKR